MIEVTAYKCQYCNKTMLDKKKMEKHEDNCIKKPIPWDVELCFICPPIAKMNCINGIKICKK